MKLLLPFFRLLAAVAAIGAGAAAHAAPDPLGGVTAVAVGGAHTCALVQGGGVKCWGANLSGQLGDGTTNRRLTPVDVVGMSRDVVAISAGAAHTCALTRVGAIKCWGENASGQLGDGSNSVRTTPVTVAGFQEGALGLAAGHHHTCAVDKVRAVYCWGQNGSGQLGDDSVPHSPFPMPVATLQGGVSSVAAGGFHSCAVSLAGAAKCWGENSFGQLGIGVSRSSVIPTEVVGLDSGVSSLSAGMYHTCARLTGGQARCWGGNLTGAVGDGTNFDTYFPVTPLALGSDVMAIASGEMHTCALLVSARVKCWGINGQGQIGDGSFVERRAPVEALSSTGPVVSLAAGGTHTCAVAQSGFLECWGGNLDGELGSNSLFRRLTPVEVSGLDGATAAIATGLHHTCALGATGGVSCWGLNAAGQVGDGSTSQRLSPVAVSLQSRQVAIAAGDSHTCALDLEGKVSCWGGNPSGQLGDGGTIDRRAPVPASVLTVKAISITAGGEHTCAITVERAVKCWGGNSLGQLGDGTFVQRSTAADVAGIAGAVIALESGAQHTCALIATGEVRCWGGNFSGQLGDGSFEPRPRAEAVSGLGSDVVAIAAGRVHTCALARSGAVKCWGANGGGQLGDASFAEQPLPVDVAGLFLDVSAISTGSAHGCAASASGPVRCWGSNVWGQLGDNSTQLGRRPVEVLGLAGAVAVIRAGAFHTCALMVGGGVRCWGYNIYGQIGDGTAHGRPVGAAVVAADVPGPPILGQVTAANASALLGFLAPPGDGGSPIQYFTASCSPGGIVVSADRSPIQISGLSNGTPYSCSLTATNARGTGPASPSARFTPATVPGAPVSVTATAGDRSVVVTFVPPASDGGAPIIAFEATCAGSVVSGTASPITVTGLENGTPVSCSVVARNAVGSSLPSSASNVVVPFTRVAVSISLASSANPAQSGQAVTFTASFTGASGTPTGSTTFRDGSIELCTNVPLANGAAACSASGLAAGSHTISVSYSGDASYLAAVSSPLNQTVAAAVGTLVNLSTRGPVLTGSDVLIGGFTIGGSTSKTVVVRARGPSLVALGVPNALANPVLSLFSGQTVIASNDNWQTAANAPALQSSGFAPPDSLESAILVTLAPGAYTAIVSGAGGGTGVGMFEVFEVDHPEALLVNVSTRGRVLAGTDVLIGGFVIQGNGPQTVVVRARGPSLGPLGVPDTLANPMLQLVRSSDQATVGVNDNWESASNASQITASGFAPPDSRESAILVTLEPGAYTVIVTGFGGATGVGLVEVFRVQ